MPTTRLSFVAEMTLRRTAGYRKQIARIARGEFTGAVAFASDAKYKPTKPDRGGAEPPKGSDYDWVYGKHATDKEIPDAILAAFDRYRDAEMTYGELAAAVAVAGLTHPPTPEELTGYVRELVFMQILAPVEEE
jgi:hypothetical protein